MFTNQRIREIKAPETCPRFNYNQEDQLNGCGLRSAQWLVRQNFVQQGAENFGAVGLQGGRALEFLVPRDNNSEHRMPPTRDFECLRRECGACIQLEFSPFGTNVYVLAEPDQAQAETSQ